MDGLGDRAEPRDPESHAVGPSPGPGLGRHAGEYIEGAVP
jgi:hypothetical protein